MEEWKGEGGGGEGRGVLDLPLKYMVTLITGPIVITECANVKQQEHISVYSCY